MNAIVFYTHGSGEDVIFEYNFYDNTFAPSNLVVRKVFMAMLASIHFRLTHLEVEYNDSMLADKLGKRAAEILRLLGASGENMRENKSGDVVVSRQFRAELTPERYGYFYHLIDISELPHYKLLQGDKGRIVFYFNQYLKLSLPQGDETLFYAKLREFQIPYKLVSI